MLLDALITQDRNRPSAPAVADASMRLTYRRLTDFATVMRALLLAETQAESVGLILPGGGAFAGSFFGTLWAGKAAVPLNFLLNAGELDAVVRDSGIDLIISAHVFDKLTTDLPARTICLDDLPLKRRIFAARFKRRPPVPEIDPNDLAVLLYTSGTSGEPKGVELSHRNLRTNCDAIIEKVGLKETDRFLSVLPPFHVFGLTANVLVPAVCGISVHAIPRFSPAAVLRGIRDFDPTVMLAVSSMYGAILRQKSAPSDAFEGFRLLVSGGEPLPPKVAESFAQRFGQELLEGYGLSETSPVISLDIPEKHRRGSVGTPLSNVEVRVVNDDGREVPAGTDGEIHVRGPNIMRGYHNQPEQTAAVLDDDGWFATGDIGTYGEDGFLTITGRKKEMIIIGGENVFPGEIEGVLTSHPAVDEAAVIGVQDASRGEVPLAFVILKEDHLADDKELRSFARQHLAGYKVPREIRVMTELPHGPTGKIAKRLLTESLVDESANAVNAANSP